MYRCRNVVARCVCWLKENRQLGAGYDKLASGFMGVVTLALIRGYLRLLHQSDTPQAADSVVQGQCSPRVWP